MPNAPWTKEQDELLTQLWCSGVAAHIIRARFPDRTRNSLIGRAHRLRLARKLGPLMPRSVAQRRASARKNPYRPKAPIDTPEALPMIAPPPQNPVAFMDLRWYHCRAVADQHGPDDGLAMYCGIRTIEGRSFCSYHASIFYREPKYRGRTSNGTRT